MHMQMGDYKVVSSVQTEECSLRLLKLERAEFGSRAPAPQDHPDILHAGGGGRCGDGGSYPASAAL